MKRFEKLNALTATLTPSEKNLCRKGLKTLSVLGEYELKNFQLFDLLQKQSQITESEAARKLYGKTPKGSAFVRLQLRLLLKILGILSDEQQISRESLISSRVRARILLRQRMNDADVLITRKLYFIAVDLLNDAIATAEKFELFDEQLSAFALKENIARLQKEETKAAEIVLKILELRQRISILTTAAQLSAVIRQPEWLDMWFEMDERLKELRQTAKEFPSATTTFLLMDIEAMHMKEQCQYAAAAELFQQQLAFALRHPALSDHYLVNEIYQQLAACAVYQRKFNKALELLMNAIHEQRLHPWQKEAVYIRFHALFYKKNYEEALSMTANGLIPESAALYHYWNAACYFMQKQYRKAALCLQKVSFFELALHNCGAWPMFLLQMAIIEEGKLIGEELKKELIEIRKRYTADLLGREEKVDEFMKQLIEYDFNFERTALKCKRQLTLLKARRGDFSFEIFSGELVVFQKWVMVKAGKSIK
jgi:tetratricopeptide (TPR) repeat protein